MTTVKRVVVKVGTRTLTSHENKLEVGSIRDLVRQLCDLSDGGVEMLLVTSGAIAAGMGLLGLRRRPAELASLQAVAAIGQNHLMDVYNGFFRARGYIAGQVLLTQDDFNDRTRYLNIRNTLDRLLKYRAIPVINENDTVSNDEIRCGDNDRLSSLVADLARADLLVILTDVDGLLDGDGKVVSVVEELDDEVMKLVRSSCSEVSRGGMATKLEAARRVAQAGIGCVVASGRAGDVVVRAVRGQCVGTFFRAKKVRHLARERWIAFSSKPKGAIVVDGGAKEVLLKMKKSLLPSGIVSVRGNFKPKDTVSIEDRSEKEFARGIVNYSCEEVERIRGKKTREIEKILGRKARDEVVHRDDLVIL